MPDGASLERFGEKNLVFFKLKIVQTRIDFNGVFFLFFSDIHCMRTTNTKTFTSFLRLPQNFLSPPVLENVGSESIDPTQCLITRTNVDGIFALDLSQVSWSCPV